MKALKDYSKEELQVLYEELTKEYADAQAKGLKLDMSRGKPGADQLDLTMPMLDVLSSKDVIKSEAGVDLRNYGIMDGIPECKTLMKKFLEAPEEQIIVFGAASLNIMFDFVCHGITHGVCGNKPWGEIPDRKWLCIVPGYDRHFAVTKYFGFNNICVPMYDDGPDMDMIEKLVAEDDTIKGVWCVPKYANPTGLSFSDETVKRFANLKPAAKDFRIFWDNAYCIHHLYADKQDKILNILDECAKAGNPDMVYVFGSTSKVTFPGAGVAAMASSPANIADFKSQMKWQTIGHDKINQLRHVKYFNTVESLEDHMMKHADILRPKFEMVCNMLEEELGELRIGRWTKPVGGYFISFWTPDGCAKAVVEKCKNAGVVMTPAGATYPDGNDPQDSNIRIAPSLPPVEELKQATKLFALCVKLAAVEQLLK